MPKPPTGWMTYQTVLEWFERELGLKVDGSRTLFLNRGAGWRGVNGYLDHYETAGLIRAAEPLLGGPTVFSFSERWEQKLADFGGDVRALDAAVRLGGVVPQKLSPDEVAAVRAAARACRDCKDRGPLSAKGLPLNPCPNHSEAVPKRHQKKRSR